MPTTHILAKPRENRSLHGLATPPTPFCRQKSHDATKCLRQSPISDITRCGEMACSIMKPPRPRHPALTSPSKVVFLGRTSGARPAISLLGVAGSFDFVVAIQRRVLSPSESPFASGFLPSTTTDFLAPRGNCVHHADHVSQHLMLQRRGRISVSHQTDSRVPRTLAITPSRPSFFGECGRGTRSRSAHAVRGVNVRTTRTEKKE